ncbi:MAG: hypothetical protein HOP19_16875 [Acidobacteria bacterium]|nr:hypothetical protein [Acidobacteriota bacterium]
MSEERKSLTGSLFKGLTGKAVYWHRRLSSAGSMQRHPQPIIYFDPVL